MPKQPQQGELALKKKIPMKKGGIGKPKPKRNLDFVKRYGCVLFIWLFQ